MTAPAIQQFFRERREASQAMAADPAVRSAALEFLRRTLEYKYTLNATWLGRPIVQFPPDIVALQELVWKVRPELIIETGVAHGGSLVLHASLLELLGGDGRVLGVDIDIRPHNRRAIEHHPMSGRIDMIEGSSTAPAVVEQVRRAAVGKRPVLVVLDSLHTHDHVLAELEAYARLVTPGSYCVVLDTFIEDMPAGSFPDRPWGKGDNPKTAVWEFLESTDAFRIDREFESYLGGLTCAPDGFLIRTDSEASHGDLR